MEEAVNEVIRYSKQVFSADEKRDYCMAFEKSTMKPAEFCKKNGFSRSAFRNWYNDFKEGVGGKSNFSPLYERAERTIKQDKIQFAVRLSNQIEFCMAMDKSNLISFIQELCHATAIIR